MQIAKKISVGTINGVRGGFKNVTAERFAGRMFGIARSFKVKDTNFGEAMQFMGEFRAVNEDGEEVMAPVMYLPSPADGLLRAALEDAKGGSVTCAFDVFVAPKDKRSSEDLGYTYVVRPLMESKPSDPLAGLMASLPAPKIAPKQAALPGTEPTPAAEPAPVAEPTPAAQPTTKAKSK